MGCSTIAASISRGAEDPEGVTECSHGWSETEPVVRKHIRPAPAPDGRRKLPTPLSRRVVGATMVFRFARPLATACFPIGANCCRILGLRGMAICKAPDEGDRLPAKAAGGDIAGRIVDKRQCELSE